MCLNETAATEGQSVLWTAMLKEIWCQANQHNASVAMLAHTLEHLLIYANLLRWNHRAHLCKISCTLCTATLDTARHQHDFLLKTFS